MELFLNLNIVETIFLACRMLQDSVFKTVFFARFTTDNKYVITRELMFETSVFSIRIPAIINSDLLHGKGYTNVINIY